MMRIVSTKKAASQLQKIINKLGENGGIIATDTPETWWNLDVEIENISDNEKNIMIGLYMNLNDEIMFDPVFDITAIWEKNKITEVIINSCTEETVLGRTVVDDNNMIHGFGRVEKDPYGLKKRFCSFMDGITTIGPYLSTGRIIEKYDE